MPSVSSGFAVLAECVRHCGSVAGIGLWFTPALAALLSRLPSVHACPRGSVAAFALGSRLSFFLCQEKRDGLRCVALSWCWRGCRAWRERGAGLRGDAFSITALGLRSMPELAVLLGRFALGAGLALRLYRGVLPSFTPDFAALSGRFALGSRLTLWLCRGALPLARVR